MPNPNIYAAASWDGKRDWNEETIQRLRDLWLSGKSSATIGRAIGCGKNAAIGKAHRIGLPSRQSPIGPRNEVVRSMLKDGVLSVKEITTRTKISERAAYDIKREFRMTTVSPPLRAPTLPPPPPDAPVVVAFVPRPPVARVERTCQFIAGHGRPWAMCGEAVGVGHPSWCERHRRVVFTKVREVG